MDLGNFHLSLSFFRFELATLINGTWDPYRYFIFFKKIIMFFSICTLFIWSISSQQYCQPRHFFFSKYLWFYMIHFVSYEDFAITVWSNASPFVSLYIFFLIIHFVSHGHLCDCSMANRVTFCFALYIFSYYTFCF